MKNGFNFFLILRKINKFKKVKGVREEVDVAIKDMHAEEAAEAAEAAVAAM